MNLLTSWPWMNLIWHKIIKGLGGHKYPRRDAFRSIVFISVWYGCFARRSQQWQIIENLTFDPTCGVISDLQMNFYNIFWKLMPGAMKFCVRIENGSNILIDSTWGGTPPPLSAGRVREYPIGARVNAAWWEYQLWNAASSKITPSVQHLGEGVRMHCTVSANHAVRFNRQWWFCSY